MSEPILSFQSPENRSGSTSGSIDLEESYSRKIRCRYSTSPDGTMEGSTWKSYFSKNLHSAIYELSRKDLKAVYHDNTRFVEHMNRLSLLQSPFKINKTTGQYRFIDWL